MINIEQQRTLFVAIAEKMPMKITVYAIGGTAMMLLGLKEQTLDIDLVFRDKKDREIFKNVALSLGYKESDTRIIYGTKPNAPEIIKLDTTRLDLFLLNILGIQFSDDMITRAEQIHEFGSNLIIRPANIHDIVIMKSATQRGKDEIDIVTILKDRKINWEILIQESKNQVFLGNERAILSLGHLLERLTTKGRFIVPQRVLDSLWSLLKEQVRPKKKS